MLSPLMYRRITLIFLHFFPQIPSLFQRGDTFPASQVFCSHFQLHVNLPRLSLNMRFESASSHRAFPHGPGTVMALETPVGNRQEEHRQWSETADWRESSAGEPALAGQALLQRRQGWGRAGPLVN